MNSQQIATAQHVQTMPIRSKARNLPAAFILLMLLIAAIGTKRKITPQQFAEMLDPHLLGTGGPWVGTMPLQLHWQTNAWNFCANLSSRNSIGSLPKN